MRSARPEDAAAGLLFLSAAPYYAAYAGGEARALGGSGFVGYVRRAAR